MAAISAQRILTTLEKPLFEHVRLMAKRDGVSLSQKVRDILREAADRDEDADLAALVAERKKKRGKFHTMAEMSKRYGW